MAFSVVSATFITMPKANLQLPIYKPKQHRKNIIINCDKHIRPPVKGGGGGQTNGEKKKKITSDSGRISNAPPALKETQEKSKPKHHEGSSEKSVNLLLDQAKDQTSADK
ncbi:uncharacterized protein LOC123214899 [Mangifera indica]|uniref:uncharacterized protein LOC123214899 n=1 Tax=Mangifera indica TaxID=29780 RepID=UPI001CF95EC8|nr:uncharacterized protein LOC123214899 [Mangifera indica]